MEVSGDQEDEWGFVLFNFLLFDVVFLVRGFPGTQVPYGGFIPLSISVFTRYISLYTTGGGDRMEWLLLSSTKNSIELLK